MSGFHEVSLPLPFALGASGGPERRVDIVALGSGGEARNTPWAHGRRRYDIGGAVRTLDELHELLTFFEARRGRLHGFRFRDPFDCKSCAPSATPSPEDQVLGVGDGVRAAFQLVKMYAVETATGMVTLSTPPTEDAVVSAGFVFETPVRFDIERLDLSLDGFGAGRALAVPLIEILI